MIKFAVVFLFLSIVYCENVKRQTEQDDRNPFIRYRNEDRVDEISDREWQIRRQIERRDQRQRERDQRERQRYIVEWIEGDFEDSEQQRYEWERQQQMLRERAEYENYELERNVQPYWTSYEPQVIYPWGYPYIYM